MLYYALFGPEIDIATTRSEYQDSPASVRPRAVRGYLYIAAAAFFWGLAATLGRAVFTSRLLRPGHSSATIDPLILSQSRTTISFLLLLPILALHSGLHRLRLRAADIGRTFLIGVLGIAAANYFYYLAIQRTNVATAIILQYTAPIWVLLYAITRGLEKPNLRRAAAVTVAVSGIAMVIGPFSPGRLALDTVGVVAALLSAFSFAFYNVYGHGILARHNRWTVLLYATMGASIFWILINPPWKVIAAHLSGEQWIFLLVFALVSVVIPFAFYFAGLQCLKPTPAVVASCLEPVFSVTLAALLLGELLRPVQMIGIAFVLVAIVAVQVSDREMRYSGSVENTGPGRRN
jgi:drug/metabolite transporter (DMT)-like permease